MSVPRMKTSSTTQDDARWAAIVNRDARADGLFFYSVKTTGVYCRPSCRARQPRRENVSYHETREAAEAAGFRACRRCRPNQASPQQENASRIAYACRLIETAEEPPPLSALAGSVGLSESHFHRLFKTITGLTPMQYARAERARRAQERLSNAASVTEAITEAGYESSSRFYENSMARLGMRPGDFRREGRNADIYFAIGPCSLGHVLVGQTERGVCAILLGDNPDELLRDFQKRFARANLIGSDNRFEQTLALVIGLVENPSVGLELPLDIRGTLFQERVWAALREVPPGATVSYADLARRIGRPKAVRAVAGACAANPLAIAIPCHRVVKSDGELSGYRWGIERKAALLEKEARR